MKVELYVIFYNILFLKENFLKKLQYSLDHKNVKSACAPSFYR